MSHTLSFESPSRPEVNPEGNTMFAADFGTSPTFTSAPGTPLPNLPEETADAEMSPAAEAAGNYHVPPQEVMAKLAQVLHEANVPQAAAILNYILEAKTWDMGVDFKPHHHFALPWARYVRAGFGGRGPQDYEPWPVVVDRMYPKEGNIRFPAATVLVWACLHKLKSAEIQLEFKDNLLCVKCLPKNDPGNPEPVEGNLKILKVYYCVFKDCARYLKKWHEKNFRADDGSLQWDKFTTAKLKEDNIAPIAIGHSMLTFQGLLNLHSVDTDDFWMDVQQSHHKQRPPNDNGWLNEVTENEALRYALWAHDMQFPKMTEQKDYHATGGIARLRVSLRAFLVMWTDWKDDPEMFYKRIYIDSESIETLVRPSKAKTTGEWAKYCTPTTTTADVAPTPVPPPPPVPQPSTASSSSSTTWKGTWGSSNTSWPNNDGKGWFDQQKASSKGWTNNAKGSWGYN